MDAYLSKTIAALSYLELAAKLRYYDSAAAEVVADACKAQGLKDLQDIANELKDN